MRAFELLEVQMKASRVYKVGSTGDIVMPKIANAVKSFWKKSFPEVEVEFFKTETNPKTWTLTLAHHDLDDNTQIESDMSELIYIATRFDDVLKAEAGESSGWFPDVDKYEHVLPWISIEVTCK